MPHKKITFLSAFLWFFLPLYQIWADPIGATPLQKTHALVVGKITTLGEREFLIDDALAPNKASQIGRAHV